MSDESIRQTAEQNVERFKRGLRAICNGAVFDPADLKRKAYVSGYLEGHAAALAEQGETEWEFSWVGTDDEGDEWVMNDTFDTRESAEAYTRRPIGGWVHTDHGELVRRRKAGQWMPVEQGEEQP